VRRSPWHTRAPLASAGAGARRLQGVEAARGALHVRVAQLLGRGRAAVRAVAGPRVGGRLRARARPRHVFPALPATRAGAKSSATSAMCITCSLLYPCMQAPRSVDTMQVRAAVGRRLSCLARARPKGWRQHAALLQLGALQGADRPGPDWHVPAQHERTPRPQQVRCPGSERQNNPAACGGSVPAHAWGRCAHLGQRVSGGDAAAGAAPLPPVRAWCAACEAQCVGCGCSAGTADISTEQCTVLGLL